MQTKPIFTFLFIILASLGGWGVWKIVSSSGLLPMPNTEATTLTDIDNSFSQETKKNTFPEPENSNLQGEFLSLFREVKQHLQNNRAEEAINQVNDQYSQLSSDQLDALKRLFIRQGLSYSDNGQYNKAQRLYSQLTSLFNDVEVLDLLSNTYIKLKDWQAALDALLDSSLLESRPDALIKKQSALANIAAQLKQTFQASEDFASIQNLYQRLYEAHPGYAYFQFELALAQLKLGDTQNAKALLSAIQYDLDIGSAAQEQLTLIREREKAQQPALAEQSKPTNSSDIIVPLTRVGNSFLVNGKINGRQTRLLLDTGASITALSLNVIDQLNLPATGEVIRLSTANGVTESRLFLAKRIQLGRIVARDLVVAEIDLGDSGRFQGLLGTDLLNQINGNYLIDNQNNNLIFRP